MCLLFPFRMLEGVLLGHEDSGVRKLRLSWCVEYSTRGVVNVLRVFACIVLHSMLRLLRHLF